MVNAKSAVVIGLNYGPHHDPMDISQHSGRAAISVYARGGDYYAVLKKRLKRRAHLMGEKYDWGVKVFVHNAPLME